MDEKRKFVVIARNYNYSIILGDLFENEEHKHFSIHIALSLKDELEFFINNDKRISMQPVVIASNIKHRIIYKEGNPLMIMSISPLSNLGLYLKNRLNNAEFTELEEDNLLQALRLYGYGFYRDNLSEDIFQSKIDEALNRAIPFSTEDSLEHIDPKIVRALGIIYSNFEEVIPAQTMAGWVNLSTSRFLHLFRAEIGMTYRRMQLWMKLALSFRLYPASSNLTDLALSCGFSDSAHYSREFKITFGVSPSVLLKNSQFIQGKDQPE